MSLTNSAGTPQQVVVDLSTDLTGLPRSSSNAVEVVAANGARSTTAAQSGRVTVTVPARGLVALVVRNVTVHRPGLPFDDIVDHGRDSFHEVDSDPATEYGSRADAPGPSRRAGVRRLRADRHRAAGHAVVPHRHAGGAAGAAEGVPVRMDDPRRRPHQDVPIHDHLRGTTTPEVTLRLPARISGANPGLAGDVIAQATGTAGDRVPLIIEVRNATDDPITGTVAVTLPSGWQIDGAVPSISVPAQGSARVESAAVIATAAALGEVEVKAKLTIAGEEPVTLRPAAIEVIDRRRLVSLTSDVEIVSGPGAVATLTALVINTGVTPLQGTLALYGLTGWSVGQQSATITVPPRSDLTHTWTVTAGAGVAPGSSTRFEVRLDQTLRRGVLVRVADEGVIAHTQSPWPGYLESGNWYPSGLSGWNGTRTRYSDSDSVGSTVTWNVDLPQAGLYRVSVWYPTNPTTTTSAAYVVEHKNGSSEVIVDQTQGAAAWRSLGSFRYAAGATGTVRLEVRNTSIHRVSAAQFVRIGD